MTKWIWLDMDGSIADLYGEEKWLEDILAHDTRPYENAKIMYNTVELITILIDLKIKGYNIGIISWLSKDNDIEYGTRVAKAKKEWLQKNFLDYLIDKILITPYGVCKADTCRPYGYGILVDDEKPNRDSWNLGEVINGQNNIIIELQKLL